MKLKKFSYLFGISVIALILGYLALSPREMLLCEALVFFCMFILQRMDMVRAGKDTRITLDNIFSEVLTTMPYFICLLFSILGLLLYVSTFFVVTSNSFTLYAVGHQAVLYITMMLAFILAQLGNPTSAPKSPNDFKAKNIDFAKFVKSWKGRREIRKLKQQCKECNDRKYVDWTELNKFEIRPFYYH